MELKTPNTNWWIPGILNKHRPITKNFAGVVKDARKLARAPGQGIVCFALFPVPIGSAKWAAYLTRITEELAIPLSEARHCTRVTVDLGDGQGRQVVVCAFLHPAAGLLPQLGF